MVAAALRVLSAISCSRPTNTTAQDAVSRTSNRNPSGPLAIVTPNTMPSAMIAIEITMPFVNSATRRPSTSAERETGAARSLSK